MPPTLPDQLSNLPFDPLAAAVLRDPYPFYAWLRAHDPVHRGAPGEAGTAGAWYITRYADVVDVLKDPRFGREVTPGTAGADAAACAADYRQEWMVLRDPPYHTYLRTLVQRAFTPQMIQRWEPRIRAIAEELAAPLRERTTFDLLLDLAVPFPVLVVAEMLGVGIHYCMGAALARMEGRVMFETILRHLPPLEVDLQTLSWQRTVAVRGLTALPVAHRL